MALGLGALFPHAEALPQQQVDPHLSDPAADAAPGRDLAAVVALARSPLAFEQNRGQFDPGVDFVANGPGFNLLLGATGTRIGLRRANPIGPTHTPAWLVTRLVGADADAPVYPHVELPSRSHYYLGADPSAWIRDVPQFSRVEYRGVYRGIDLVYYGRNGELEYDFVIHPGSDPADIQIRIEGTRKAEITESGDLRLETADGSLVHRRPVAYQTIDGRVRPVSARFQLRNDDGAPLARIAVEGHDPEHALVVDPVLAYSSFLGSSGNELFPSVAVDRAGNIYVGGTLSPFSALAGDTTAFVTKLSPAATPSTQFTVYLGGSGTDSLNALAIGASGDVYITGTTNSANLPTCVAVTDCARFGGSNDAFVAKFTPAGMLAYSRYLGGSGSDAGNAIVTDASGNFYVAGNTNSPNFPVAAARQPFFGGGQSDIFVTKFNSAGSIVYSTYLGSSGMERANAIAIGASGSDLYLAGYTDALSASLPVSGGAQRTFGGGTFDGYIAHFNQGGTLLSATRLGGSGDDIIEAIATGPAGVAVAGRTTSVNFPVVSPFQRTLAGSQDAFVTWLSPTLGSFVRSTYLGSSGSDAAYAVAFQPDGDLWVAGSVGASGFPEVAPFAPRPPITGPSDAFVTHFSAAGAIVNSSYLGGSGTDAAFALALDPQGGVLVAGHTESPNFPTANAFQPAKGAGYDTFLVRIAQPVRLSNLSTRGSIQTGDNIMIGGFVVQGASPKKVLIKAKGPSLTAYGVAGAMENPTVQLFSGQTLISSNDDWGTNGNASEIQATGLAPTDPRESAILRSLAPGAYTALVSGTAGTTGIGMVEVFEIDNPDVPLSNLSTRGPVQTGDGVMIGGFVIRGDTPRSVLITGRGPSLTAFGVSGALGNPRLQLFSGQTVIATNDDWGSAPNASSILATGYAPTDPLESAILVTLNPGAYTAILDGADGGTGVGIIEVFSR